MRKTLSVLALLCAVTRSPSEATIITVSGSGESTGFTANGDILSIVRGFEGSDTVFHIRNVGSQTATFEVIPQCALQSAECSQRSGIVVLPVARRSDASRDAVVAFRGVSVDEVAWIARVGVEGPILPRGYAVKLPNSALTAESRDNSEAQTDTVSGHGETSAFIPVGSSYVKFFVQTDAHSTGIYIRNLGRSPIGVTIIPHCEHQELCPPLRNAIVAPTTNAHDGSNDYVHTLNTLDPVHFDWQVWPNT